MNRSTRWFLHFGAARLLFAAAVWLSMEATALHAATYHVDGTGGSDDANGLTPDSSWKTLVRANRQILQPGDKLLFKAGTRYVGQLAPQGTGAVVAGRPTPVTVSSYGDGPRPRIDAEGRHLDALLLRNTSFWEIEDLEFTNYGPERQPRQTGVHIIAEGCGVMRHIRLRNLYVHDVNGDLTKRREGCGIFFEARGGNGSRFDDLRIEFCHVLRTDRNGICQFSDGSGRSTGVVIRHNLLEDIGGDGIKPWGSNGALVQNNVLRGGRMRCQDYAAGIWPWDCDNTIIQFNEVTGMKGIKDGQAFDSDYRCRRSLFQYNYSHDNEGGFFLICSPGSSYNEGTVIRYNVSVNDGLDRARVFHFAGSPRHTRIYNNTIYVSAWQELPLVLCTEWDKGNASDTLFANNLFWVDGKVRFVWGKSTNLVFVNNVFFGGVENPPPDAAGTTNRPPLVFAGHSLRDRVEPEGLRWQAGATPIRGRLIPDNGGRDFFGYTVLVDSPPCVGAAEAPGKH